MLHCQTHTHQLPDKVMGPWDSNRTEYYYYFIVIRICQVILQIPVHVYHGTRVHVYGHTRVGSLLLKYFQFRSHAPRRVSIAATTPWYNIERSTASSILQYPGTMAIVVEEWSPPTGKIPEHRVPN